MTMSDDAKPVNTDMLREVAEAADEGGREWFYRRRGVYPQQIMRTGDVVLVAETSEGPEHPPVFAEFIATCSPPVILALLDEVERLRAKARALEQYQPHDFIERRVGVRRPDGSVEPVEIGERIDTRDTPLISVERDVTAFQAQASPWREAR